ncbi:MAG TPA: alpha-L-fucosidase, partial [Armatimonadota bacterium]
MSDRYRQSYRGYLIDHHSPDPPVVTFDRLDIADYEKCFQLAHVDQVLQYCKDHWGNCYYPSEVGRPHPALAGRDFVGEIQELCGRQGYEFMAYYSVGFDTGAVRAHPDWALRDEAGNMVRTKADGRAGWPDKWHWACGSTMYAEFACDHLREIVDRYHPDSVFLDIFGQPVCWCPACENVFLETYGRPLPRGAEKDTEWRLLLDWQRALHLDFLQDLVEAVKTTDPAVAVTVNGGHSYHFPEVLELLDFTYAEPWAGNFVSAGFARGTGVSPQIGPGGLSQVYNTHKPSVYLVEQANIVAQGCRAFMFSGSQRTDGSLDELEFRNIGQAYAEIEKFQPLLTDREAIASVGVLFSPETLILDNPGQGWADNFAPPMENAYREQFSGAINDLAHSKYPYEVVPV